MFGGEEQIVLTNPERKGTTLVNGSLGGEGGMIFPFSIGSRGVTEEEEEEEAKCSPNCSPTRMKAILRQRLRREAKSGVAITSFVSADIFVRIMSSRVNWTPPAAAASSASREEEQRSVFNAASINAWKVGAQTACPVAVVEPEAGFTLSPDSTCC